MLIGGYLPDYVLMFGLEVVVFSDDGTRVAASA